MVVISLRRRDQLKPDVVRGVLGKFIQSNARFQFVDRFEVHLDYVRMPAENGRTAEKTKERSLYVMSAIKNSIVTLKAAMYCLVHALIIAMAKVNGDPKYPLYRDGKGLKKHVEDLLKACRFNLRNAGGFKKLQPFQEYLLDYKIIVYDGLSPDSVMCSGNSVSAKNLYLLYEAKDKHYKVITNLKAAMAKRYICNACDALYDQTHKCDKVCSLCTGTPPCKNDQIKHFATCNMPKL